MKVLVAAKRLAPNRTSEGICSSKYVAALVAAGHEVSCITNEQLSPSELAWHAAHAPLAEWPDAQNEHWTTRLAKCGAGAAYSARKFNGAAARATGYSLAVWAEVARWRTAIERAVSAIHPDVIVVRGAGREFEPHMAMLGWRAPAPWIAHYHDPYPISLYPEPYRRVIAFQSPRQERVHRQIVAAADGLTFPSNRLLEWVLRAELESARGKAIVVPHIAGGRTAGVDDANVEPSSSGSHQLNILHAGTMLRERDPRAFLRGVSEVAQDGRARGQIRLTFLGRVDSTHARSTEWQTLEHAGVLDCNDQRVSYASAAAAAKAADCLLIVEANAAESPFFPAKLADYVHVGKPIMAVTPDASVTSDVLGVNHPLRVAPDDAARAARAVAFAWTAWREHRLPSLAPPPRVAASMSESAAAAASLSLFDHVLSTRKGRAA
jgi:hypothetical protein